MNFYCVSVHFTFHICFIRNAINREYTIMYIIAALGNGGEDGIGHPRALSPWSSGWMGYYT